MKNQCNIETKVCSLFPLRLYANSLLYPEIGTHNSMDHIQTLTLLVITRMIREIGSYASIYTLLSISFKIISKSMDLEFHSLHFPDSRKQYLIWNILKNSWFSENSSLKGRTRTIEFSCSTRIFIR